jgi:hypothetical protein
MTETMEGRILMGCMFPAEGGEVNSGSFLDECFHFFDYLEIVSSRRVLSLDEREM